MAGTSGNPKLKHGQDFSWSSFLGCEILVVSGFGEYLNRHPPDFMVLAPIFTLIEWWTKFDVWCVNSPLWEGFMAKFGSMQNRKKGQ